MEGCDDLVRENWHLRYNLLFSTIYDNWGAGGGGGRTEKKYKKIWFVKTGT